MAFPDTELDLRAELLLSGAWTDVSQWLDHGPVTIGRGHPDESTTVSPSTLAMTLTNGDGRFASKNPTGPYYGSLGRNVPVRISIPAQTNYMRLEDDTVSYASAPDASRLDITGDIDVQIDLAPSSYAGATLCSKIGTGTASVPALVQTATGTATSGTSVTVTLSATVEGNCLVIYAGASQTTTPTVSGVTLGGSAVNVVKAASGSQAAIDCEIWIIWNIAGVQTSVVVSFNAGSGAGQGNAVRVEEWSGVQNTASPLDKAPAGTAANPSSVFSSNSTGTLSNASELVVGAAAEDDGSGAALAGPAAPWVNQAQVNAGTGVGLIAGHQAVTSTAAQTYSGTVSLSLGWAAAIATLKAALAPENSWLLELGPDGTLYWFWWDSGAGEHVARSTAAIPFGRIAVRVTLQVSTGTVTFYTAPSIGGTWTQLGSTVVVGATSVFNSTSPVWVGDNTKAVQGAVYGFRLLNGIGGTVVAYADFTSQTAGAASWTDGQGNTWTLNGTAEISGRDYRGHFEAAKWPQHHDPSGKTVTVAVAGGGLLRRLGQRSQPVESPMRRAILNLSGALAPVVYWPCEDIGAATGFGSAIGGPPMNIYGTPAFGGDSAFACSAPLATIGSSTWYGPVPEYTSGGSIVVRFLLDLPSSPGLNVPIVQVMTTGSCPLLSLYAGAGTAGYGFAGYGFGGNTVFDSGTFAFGAAYTTVWASIELQPGGGGTVNWSLVLLPPGTFTGEEVLGSFTGTIGNVTGIYVNPAAAAVGGAAGHFTVQSVWESLFALYQPLDAWDGELAGNRFARLCSEEGIAFRAIGDLAATPPMGAQDAQTLTQLLQECADADRGTWTELRQQLGFGYTTLGALCNQAPAVTVSYSSDHLEMWSADPLEDDQTTVNDVTLTQTTSGASAGSASYRAYAAPGQPVDGGSLSVLAPPAGAGTYDQSYSVNVASTAGLPDLAGWILHLGTVDEPRYPGIVLDLSNRDLASLFWAVLGMDLGQLLVIGSLPPWLPPDPAAVLCQQLSEVLWANRLEITVTGVPASPYSVAVFDDLVYGHADTDGSQLASGVSSTATSLSVSTTGPSGILWTTSAGDFPFDVDIGGERMTVTNITGSSSPQAFTVTRSVNGVVKAQASGADVRLWFPPVMALS